MRQKNTKNGENFPLSTKIKIKIMRQSTDAVLPIIQTNKKSTTVHSKYNIKYSDSNHKLQTLDWHCPIKAYNQNDITPTIFYIHGGAWASADKHIYTKLCKELCERGFNVININYRLIPEYTLTDTYQDCIDAIKYCLSNSTTLNIDTNQVILAGDSAGAHLSALIAGQVTSNVLQINCNIIGTILLYGLYDLTHLEHSKFYILPPIHKGFKQSKGQNLQQFYHDYSATTYITSKFPPSFLASGKVDALNIETLEFIDILNKNNIQNSSLIFPKERKDARHAFINLNNPARHETLMALNKFLNKLIQEGQ